MGITDRISEGFEIMITLKGKLLDAIDRNSKLYRDLQLVNARLAKKDPTIWGPAAEAEAAIRLNWVDLPSESLKLLPELLKIKSIFNGKDDLVLCGMGGSSLAPEVLAATYKKKIFILDSTDPDYVAHALNRDLKKTVVLVSSKSGSTIETTSQRKLFEESFINTGLNPKDHILFCTDPGSPLDKDVRAAGYATINADPNVGGRFSALSAFGLTPSMLLGISVEEILVNAQSARKQFASENNPAIDLAFLMATQSDQYIAFFDSPKMPGLSDWIEQLVAESTGKNGVGRVPVVISSVDEVIGSDQIRIGFGDDGDLQVIGELPSQFLLWEWSTALLGAALNVDPFNQPNVTEAKNQTAALLNEWNGKLPAINAAFIDQNVELFGSEKSITSELRKLISKIPADGYISITAYLDRQDDKAIVELRNILAEKSGRPVTFGWGPRFLHSTGQFHKGGQPNGVFLQITGAVKKDIEIPNVNYGFEALLMAQALGDGRALTERNYPLARLHLKNRRVGITELINAAKSI